MRNYNLPRNQLADVICQLRFPRIDDIGSQTPDEFRNAIADLFPEYSVHKEMIPPTVSSQNGSLNINTQPAVFNHQFSSEDKTRRINITSGFFSVACSRYDGWDRFASQLDKPLAAFIRIYRPSHFTRVGLRYLNFISRKDLELEDVPFRELIQPHFLGYLGRDGVDEQAVSQCTMDVQFPLQGGCTAKIHTGPGMVAVAGKKDPEVKFVVDLDFFLSGNIPVNVSVGALQTLHDQAFPVFRDTITDKLLNAME